MSFDDLPNKYRGSQLAREYVKFAIDKGLYTEEMEKAYNHLKFWNYMSWMAFPVRIR
jgi:hypothetical protein